MRIGISILLALGTLTALSTANGQKKEGTAQGPSFLPMDQLRSFGPKLPSTPLRQKYSQLLDALIAQVANHCETGRPVPARPATNAEMTSLDNSLRSAPTDEGKLSVLKVAVLTHWFSTRQIRDLVSGIQSAVPRVNALAVLHGRVVDPKTFHTLLDLIPDPKGQTQFLELIKPAKPVVQDGAVEGKSVEGESVKPR